MPKFLSVCSSSSSESDSEETMQKDKRHSKDREAEIEGRKSMMMKEMEKSESDPR